jgi:viroplasmin and RNaseH domain-containing protein
MGPLPDGTNNIGEFLAIVHALALLKVQGKPSLLVYSDSVTAQGWVKKGKCNTKLAQTKRNAKIFELIDRAEKWLAMNKITNPLLKWDTESWGEIPADYGSEGITKTRAAETQTGRKGKMWESAFQVEGDKAVVVNGLHRQYFFNSPG